MKGKRFKKLVLCGVVIALSIPRRVYAADYLCYHGYHTMDDVILCASDGYWRGTRYYYFKSGVPEYTRGTISSGLCEWNTASRTVHLKEIGQEGLQQITVKKKTLGTGVYGITGFTEDEIHEYPKADYNKATIELDLSNTGTSGNRLRKVATHEAGHALGFTHVTGEKSVMYPSADGALAATHLQPMDIQLIRHLYGLC